MQAEKWHYNTHQVVTRIPTLVGQVWENGYGVKLGRFECVLAASHFDGSHMGSGFGPEVLLAKDEADTYLLIKKKG